MGSKKGSGFLADGDEDEYEEGYGISVNKHLADDDEHDDSFHLFGFGKAHDRKGKSYGPHHHDHDHDDHDPHHPHHEDDDHGDRDDDEDDDDDENARRRRRRGRRQGGGERNLRYGPSGEVLDDYYTYDYDASDREYDADDIDEDGVGGGGDDDGHDGGSVYGEFEAMADIHNDYEHLD